MSAWAFMDRRARGRAVAEAIVAKEAPEDFARRMGAPLAAVLLIAERIGVPFPSPKSIFGDGVTSARIRIGAVRMKAAAPAGEPVPPPLPVPPAEAALPDPPAPAEEAPARSPLLLAPPEDGPAPAENRILDGEIILPGFLPLRTTPRGGRPSAWTPEREDRLREMHAAGISYATIAAALGLGVTEEAVKARANKLGLRRRLPSDRQPQKWTPEKLARLAELYPTDLEVEEIARELGSTANSVRRMATVNGLHRPPRPSVSPAVADQVRALHAEGKGVKPIAVALGHHPRTIRGIFRELGLMPLPPHRPPSGERAPYKWTPEKEARLAELYPTEMSVEAIAADLGITLRAMRTHAVKMGLHRPRPAQYVTGPWTRERIRKLAELAAQGLSASQIAAALGGGLTREAIIGKARRQGIKLGYSRPARAKIAKPPRPARIRRPRRTSPALAPDELPVARYIPPAEAWRVPESGGVAYLDRRGSQCAWPVGPEWDARHKDIAALRCCGEALPADREETAPPYCPAHRLVSVAGQAVKPVERIVGGAR